MSGDGAGEAPLFAGKIHGVRGWNVGRGRRLNAAYVGGEWRGKGGATIAVCAEGGHEAPDPDCACGLYALHPHRLADHGDVLGVVEAWGRVEVHADGFRAQYARPIALFSLTSVREPSWRMIAPIAEYHGCELIEVDDHYQISLVCRERGWGLDERTVSELFADAEEAGVSAPARSPPPPPRAYRPPPPPPLPWPLRVAKGIGIAIAIAVAGAVSLAFYAAYAALWGVIGLTILNAVTGWNLLGLGLDGDPSPELVRAARVRIAEDGVIPRDGERPPIYVARVVNRGPEAAVWARPGLRIRTQDERRLVTRDEFAFPVTVPAGGEALLVHPLQRRYHGEVEVRAGPVWARDVEYPPRAPATVDVRIVRDGPGERCEAVAIVDSRTRLDRLRLATVVGARMTKPRALLSGAIEGIRPGRTRHVLGRFRCPEHILPLHTFPVLKPNQLVGKG